MVVDVIYHPSGILGGDCFESFELENRWILSVFDPMTHGVKAAMNSMLLRAELQRYRHRSCRLAGADAENAVPRGPSCHRAHRRKASKLGVPLHQLSLKEMQAIEPKITRRPWTCFRWKRR